MSVSIRQANAPFCLSEPSPASKGQKKEDLQVKLFKQSINLFNSIKYQVQLKHFTFQY